MQANPVPLDVTPSNQTSRTSTDTGSFQRGLVSRICFFVLGLTVSEMYDRLVNALLNNEICRRWTLRRALPYIRRRHIDIRRQSV
jgi:hypothetical protein